MVLATLAALGAERPVLARPEATSSRPNVVLIFADDLGWGDISFNGRSAWKTPNLDRLASQGVRFERFYTGAVVCAPSRAVLLTGKYTIHNGVRRNNADLPAEQVTIAEALKARGYRTALFGKWHHGQPADPGSSYVHPMDQGFDEFFGFTNATHAWEKFPTELWDGRGKVLVDGHADDLFAAKAVDFIHQTGQESGPFFLYLPFISAHFDIEAPADEVAKHAERFEEIDRALPLRATYAAMITRFDANVGRVLGALDAQGVAGNTLVIFTSDHGATFESGNQGTSSFHDSNSPFRGQKRTLWEGGIRVPACARWPGKIPAGSERVEPMHMTDVFPTILAAAGVAPEASLALDGINLTPAWTGEASVPERSLFWEWQTEGYNQLAAMRGTHKLVITGGGKPELYDVVADPGERRDLSAQFPDDVKSLRSELHQWLATGT